MPTIRPIDGGSADGRMSRAPREREARVAEAVRRIESGPPRLTLAEDVPLDPPRRAIGAVRAPAPMSVTTQALLDGILTEVGTIQAAAARLVETAVTLRRAVQADADKRARVAQLLELADELRAEAPAHDHTPEEKSPADVRPDADYVDGGPDTGPEER